STARTPGHDIVALVEQPLLLAAFQKRPDGIVILIREGIIIVSPVGPLAQADRLLGDLFRKSKDALFTEFDKFGNAVFFDLLLIGKAQLLFHLNLDPETLAVKAILVTLLIPLHGFEALVEILVCAAPGVVNAHLVVRGHRAIQERKALLALGVALEVFMQHI